MKLHKVMYLESCQTRF